MTLSRRFLFGVLAALLIAAPAAATPIGSKLEKLNAEIAEASKREGVLTSQIQAMDIRISALRNQVEAQGDELESLEAELAVWQVRLDRATARYQAQSRRLAEIEEQLEIVKMTLARRLVAIYQDGAPDAVSVILAAESMSDVIERVEFVQQVSEHDRLVATRVRAVKRRVSAVRAETGRLRARLFTASAAIRNRTERARAVQAELLSNRNELQTARSSKQNVLSSVHDKKLEFLREAAALQAESARIADQIRGAQTNSSATPSVSGFIWPASGTVTSGFGPRWGRMHEGIDIAAPTGTPIYASASGTVIAAGWAGGYGNFTAIDHGGSVATAYGHQSSIVVSVGQTVSQGDLIGYVGSTGYSTGPHLHFEVRLNGNPVNPMLYL